MKCRPHILCTVSVQLLCKNLYDYSSILGERGFYANGYMTLMKTNTLRSILKCFHNRNIYTVWVWTAELLDCCDSVLLCCFAVVLQVLACAVRWVSSELSRCFLASVLQIGSQMFP